MNKLRYFTYFILNDRSVHSFFSLFHTLLIRKTKDFRNETTTSVQKKVILSDPLKINGRSLGDGSRKAKR
jgi:hypothetical protein